jgi:mono/diheme cytochrome c family protein
MTALTRAGALAGLLALAVAPAAAEPRSAENGGRLFARYCVTCHGVDADGRGPAARLHKPPPADLRKSRYPDAYKVLIIQRGGAALGRSGAMPPWGDELTGAEIEDVVHYLGGLKVLPR